ncbi:hypothetical protein [Vibrio gallaecicus]|nr:hypothetical protein [Vibrio gallaecicus]MDN3616715.1 hypothetical protein [Vibrio gallaecicus]
MEKTPLVETGVIMGITIRHDSNSEFVQRLKELSLFNVKPH